MTKISDKLWNRAGAMRVPLTGAFELLPICNLNCKMCYVRKSPAEVEQLGGLIPAEQWLDWARQARDAGMLYPLLTGGEPFVRQDFFEIYAGMQEMGLQISINSNGTLITEEIAKWLGKHRPVRINITLYGGSEQTYENLCGNGDAFRRVHQSVEWLRQYGVPVKFNASITPENVHDLTAMMEFAKSVGSPIQVATYMFPPVRRDERMIGQNHRLSPEEAGHARVEADCLQSELEWFMGQAARYRTFVPLEEALQQAKETGEPKEMGCRAGRCSFWLDWQGNIANCGMYPSVRFPMEGQSFADAWKQVVDQTEAVRYASVCTTCPNYRLCHPCIAMVYNETGVLDGRPEYLCRMNAASAKYYQEYARRLPEYQKIAEQIPFESAEGCALEDIGL